MLVVDSGRLSTTNHYDFFALAAVLTRRNLRKKYRVKETVMKCIRNHESSTTCLCLCVCVFIDDDNECHNSFIIIKNATCNVQSNCECIYIFNCTCQQSLMQCELLMQKCALHCHKNWMNKQHLRINNIKRPQSSSLSCVSTLFR